MGRGAKQSAPFPGLSSGCLNLVPLRFPYKEAFPMDLGTPPIRRKLGSKGG